LTVGRKDDRRWRVEREKGGKLVVLVVEEGGMRLTGDAPLLLFSPA
jgi:hypothetical protein